MGGIIGPIQLPNTSFEENCFIQVAPIRNRKKVVKAKKIEKDSCGEGGDDLKPFELPNSSSGFKDSQ